VYNRLKNEKSAYLQQHAKNPVDWYPWGEEAFEKARSLGSLVFLSIGYATCHWCHVMEKESFSNEEIGKLLNESFVNIKVDREEHPEVDTIYMNFAHLLLSGASGWPLNLILTPDLKPILALTYVPPIARNGLVGFKDIVSKIKELWNGPEKEAIILQASSMVEALNQSSNATGKELSTEEELSVAIDKFFQATDLINGGLTGAPKFPLGFQIETLLNWSKIKNDSRALFYANLTLEKMYHGGIYDHIGGGFSRYTVDEQWQTPHFEKMLYDNALLASAYLQAWKYTKKELYSTIVQEILNYTLENLQFEEGGFFCGEDSDSELQEGRYYTWSYEEVLTLIPGISGEIFTNFYGITPEGNFEGNNILHIEIPMEEYAKTIEITPDELKKIVTDGKKSLLKQRKMRQRPIRDEKILPSSNGLIIDILAQAGAAFDKSEYTLAAEKAASFIEKNLIANQKLLHQWCNKEAKHPAILDDYVFFIKALLSLFETGGGDHYLTLATVMTKNLEQDFKEIDGAFYETDGRDQLILRHCEFYDGAEPSGNAVHAENLLRLYQITKEKTYQTQAKDILKAIKPHIDHFPIAAVYHMKSLLRYLDAKSPTVIITTPDSSPDKKSILQAIAKHFSPHLVTIWKTESIKTSQHKLLFSLQFGEETRPPLTNLNKILESIDSL
jgi:uncharacterized protein